MKKATKVGIATGGAIVATGGAIAAYKLLSDGTPVAQSLSNASDAARGVFAGAVGLVNPVYRNSGARATPEQVEAWCRKVGRTQGANGIDQVGRVRTSPYINAVFPLDLRGFAIAAGEGAGVGEKGGTVLAVLLSVETNAGISPNAACYNYNFGNFKLYRQQWHADRTPPCYFLVDRVPSLDFYPSFNTPQDGIAEWARTTFANPRYARFGTMEALRAGDIRAFTRAIGQAGYARMYRDARSMDGRAQRLAGLGRFARNRAVIRGELLTFNDSIR